MKKILLVVALLVSGCKFYGSALPPEYPVSMDNALNIARDKGSDYAGDRPIIRHSSKPVIKNPSYLPEKELAVVAPPKTLLVWTYPHVTADNTRVFGNWSTIFLTDRYEWVPPANAVPAEGFPKNN